MDPSAREEQDNLIDNSTKNLHSGEEMIVQKKVREKFPQNGDMVNRYYTEGKKSTRASQGFDFPQVTSIVC